MWLWKSGAELCRVSTHPPRKTDLCGKVYCVTLHPVIRGHSIGCSDKLFTNMIRECVPQLHTDSNSPTPAHFQASRLMGDKQLNSSVEKASTQEVESVVTARTPVVFEEYLHYAALQRRAELIDPKAETSGNQAPAKRDGIAWLSKMSDHKGTNVNIDPNREHVDIPMTAEEEERAAASRSMRLASWVSIFYLITTDILGPFNAPFAISQVGWVPGKKVFFIYHVFQKC